MVSTRTNGWSAVNYVCARATHQQTTTAAMVIATTHVTVCYMVMLIDTYVPVMETVLLAAFPIVASFENHLRITL